MAPPTAARRGGTAGYLGIPLGLSMAVLVLLTGPLLLFNPWFVSVEQARNDVPARLQTTQSEVDRVTGAMLCDVWLGCGDFAEGVDGGPPLLTDAERSHMRDVSRLVRLLGVVWLVALAVAVGSGLALRRQRRAVGRALIWAGGLVGTVAVVLAAFFALDFDQAFLAFHEVFFPQGNFMFGPDSNLLRLFPEGFWFEASITAGIAIILSALAVLLVGWRLWQREATTAA